MIQRMGIPPCSIAVPSCLKMINIKAKGKSSDSARISKKGSLLLSSIITVRYLLEIHQ
jgi:hypothetical protein